MQKMLIFQTYFMTFFIILTSKAKNKPILENRNLKTSQNGNWMLYLIYIENKNPLPLANTVFLSIIFNFLIQFFLHFKIYFITFVKILSFYMVFGHPTPSWPKCCPRPCGTLPTSTPMDPNETLNLKNWAKNIVFWPKNLNW